jgi:hypothetical protein
MRIRVLRRSELRRFIKSLEIGTTDIPSGKKGLYVTVTVAAEFERKSAAEA